MIAEFPSDSTPSPLEVTLPRPYGADDIDTNTELADVEEGDSIILIDATTVGLCEIHIPNTTADHPVRVATVTKTTVEGVDKRIHATIQLPDGEEETCVVSTRDIVVDRKFRYHFIGRINGTDLITPSGSGDVSFPHGHDVDCSSSTV